MKNRQLRRETVGKAEQRRSQRQARVVNARIARLLVAKGVGLERVELDAFGRNVPEAGLDIVPAFQPAQVRSHAPVRVLTRRGPANAKIVIAAVGPVAQGHQQALVLVDVEESCILHRIKTGLVLILLAGIHSGPAGIAGAHVQNESRPKNVYPSTAVVAALRAAAGRTGLTDRSENRVPLLRVAKEHAIGVAEAVVNPHRITVGVVQCGPVANEVVGA